MDFMVNNWGRFQHYKDRDPKWIKLYGTILHDYEFTRLDCASRYHLIAIMLLAARYDNKIPWDAAWVQHQTSSPEKVDLEGLERAGFISKISAVQDDTELIAEPEQVATPEKEKEIEGEKDTTAPSDEGEKPPEHPLEILPPSNGDRDPVPKPPMAGRHKPFQFLAWNFYEGWLALFGDRPFDPWSGKCQAVFKGIMDDLGKDNYQEGVLRLRVFFKKCAEDLDGNWWVYTPNKFKQRLDECVGPPILQVQKQSKEGRARAAFADRMAVLQEELQNEGSRAVV